MHVRDSVLGRTAFRFIQHRRRLSWVISRLNGWPVGVPCQRFTLHLTMQGA